MKKMLSFAICAIMMAVCSTAVHAQNNPSNQQRLSREELMEQREQSQAGLASAESRQKKNRVQLAEKQARHIAHELALDNATTQKYVATYKAYQQEVWALGPRVKRHQSDTATEAEAEQANKARMEQSQKILDLREKYYVEYSQFLTQRQIERAYELEQQVMRRLARHHHRQGSTAGTGNHRRTSRAH